MCVGRSHLYVVSTDALAIGFFYFVEQRLLLRQSRAGVLDRSTRVTRITLKSHDVQI